MITTKKVLWEEKKCLLNIKYSCQYISQESLQWVLSGYTWQREANDGYMKQVLFQNIAERPINITSILNNFKS